MADWSCGVPRDLLVSILQSLPLRDWIRFGAVCVNWRSVVADRFQLPWLFLPDTHRCYSLSDKKEYEIHTPGGFEWGRYIGASEGWLIVLLTNRKICLLNPVSGAQIELPPIPRKICNTEPDIFEESMMAVASRNSASSFTVMVLHCPRDRRPRNCKEFLYASTGDVTWTASRSYYTILVDSLVQHKGLFYVRVFDGSVEALDLSHRPQCKFTCVAGDWRDPKEPRTDYTAFYLVESSGDLFQVVRSGLFKTIGFKVFKLDPSGPKWTVVHTLGNRAFVLGRYRSMSIPADDFPGLKGSCIYFTDDEFHHIPGLRVFDLEDGSFKTYHSHDCHLVYPILNDLNSVMLCF